MVRAACLLVWFGLAIACDERVLVGYEGDQALPDGGTASVDATTSGGGGQGPNGGATDGGSRTAGSSNVTGSTGGGDAGLPEKAALLWEAGFETGDVSEWWEDDAGGPYVVNDARYLVGEQHARTGRYALEATVVSIGEQLPQAVLLRDFQQREAYYSAYFCVREYYDTSFWVIMKLMGEEPFMDNTTKDRFDIDLSRGEDGQLHLQFDEHGGEATLSDLPVPVDEWFQIELFYRSTPELDGRLVVWQDGTQVFDTGERPTAPSERVTFGVGVAAWRVSPLPASIWIDDVAVVGVR